MKMKTLNDLKLCKKSRKKVEDWLQEWLDLFIKQANGKQGWVYRANFEDNDFFFFTDCKDILEKDPEAKAQENNLAIRSRKRKVLMQLFVKTLMGKKLGTTIKCNHCGFEPCWIEGLPDGNGHWVYCPKCKKTDVHVFPDGYDNCMNTIQLEIGKRRNESKINVCLDCRKLIKEIQSYKYEHAAKNTCDPGNNPKPKKPNKKTNSCKHGLCTNCKGRSNKHAM